MRGARLPGSIFVALLIASGCGGSDGSPKGDGGGGVGGSDGGNTDRGDGQAGAGGGGAGGASDGGGAEAMPDAPVERGNNSYNGECDPVAQACGSGKECFLTCASFEFQCHLEAGPGPKEGAACTGSCDKGLICIESKCRRWCHADADCGGKSCTSTGVLCPPMKETFGKLCAL